VKAAYVLEKDGSGTFRETTTLDLSKMGEVVELFKAVTGGGEEPGADGKPGATNPMVKQVEDGADPREIKKRLEGKPGVRLQLLSKAEDFEKQTATVDTKIKFNTIEALLRSGLGSSTTRLVDLRLEEGKDGTWTLTRKMFLPGMDLDAEPSPEAAQQMEMGKAMFEPYLGDMEVVWSIDLPGTVVATNGTKNEAGTSVTWKLTFNDMTDPKKLKQSVTFKGEGLTLKPFHVRVDQQGEADAAEPVTPTEPAKPAEPPVAPDAPKPPETPKEPASPAAPK
jgi:hypothetical protein